jgi:hypothetical protein
LGIPLPFVTGEEDPIRAARDAHGYPEITPRLRRKVFGLNAAKPFKLDAGKLGRQAATDSVTKSREAYAERPNPSFATHGPRTRREFANLLRASGGQPWAVNAAGRRWTASATRR